MMELRTQHLKITIGNKTICHDLNLTITKGEIWALLGPNGSGKTTLLHALAGLHPPVKGDIWLGETKLSQRAIKSLAQCRGILFQDFNGVFLQTVYEYCIGARFPYLPYFQREQTNDKQIVMDALSKLDLLSLTHQPIQHLSGGEKRRVQIAALLTQTPYVYLLDEPTNHLDVRHQIAVLNIFRKLAREQSAIVLMALHDINLAQQYCDKVLLLFTNGTILQGPSSQLLTSENLNQLYQQRFEQLAGQHMSLWWPA